MATSNTYYKRRIGTDTYETLKVSKYNADLFYGSENECYVFNYWNGSVADSGRLLEQCNQSSAPDQHGRSPLFTMSGIIEFLPQGFAFGKSGKTIKTKGVYRVLFSRLGTAGNLFNDFDSTLSDTCGKYFGYKTIKEAIHEACCAMVNHFAAVRGVYNADFLLKPYVKPVPAELEAAVAQVDAALATSPINLDEFAAAARRLEADCNALTAIHNASKPFVTSVAAPVPCTNTVLSKSATAAVDKASAEIKAANAVLPDATWEDLKKLAFSLYSSECECINDDADAQIAAINCRRASRLHQEVVKKNAVVDLVCNRSLTVAARLESLNTAYWGYKAQLHGKNLDVYA